MLKPRHQACRNPGHRGDQRQPQHVPGYDPVARRWRRSGAVAALELASATRAVKVLVPEPFGVPKISPELGSSAKPSGRVPALMDHE